MHLKQIKLAGFKSFVDSTTLVLPGNRCAIVGPNGCGKSNIIDAIRWVMGESSARNLRGDSMEDVIFSGSSSAFCSSSPDIKKPRSFSSKCELSIKPSEITPPPFVYSLKIKIR